MYKVVLESYRTALVVTVHYDSTVYDTGSHYSQANSTVCWVVYCVYELSLKRHNFITLCYYLSAITGWDFQNAHEAFKEDSLGWTQVFEQYAHFMDTRTSLEDDDCSRLSSTSKTLENVDKILEIIYKDQNWRSNWLWDLLRNFKLKI